MSPSVSDLAVINMKTKLLGSFRLICFCLALCHVLVLLDCLVIQPEILMGQLLLRETGNLGHCLWAKVWN